MHVEVRQVYSINVFSYLRVQVRVFVHRVEMGQVATIEYRCGTEVEAGGGWYEYLLASVSRIAVLITLSKRGRL